MRVAAIFSRHPEAMAWARETLVAAFGPISAAMEPFEFVETTFYNASMGDGLKKQIVAFERLGQPEQLVADKLAANDWEAKYREASNWPEERPLNIDPGYLTEAKLVLATTKDRDHRIYVEQGIFAEVTLYFNRGAWASRPWTYPDYQREDVQAFLAQCRLDLRHRLGRRTPEPS